MKEGSNVEPEGGNCGFGPDEFVSSQTDLSIGELIWQVVDKILKETGLRFEAQEGNKNGLFIDKIISCSEDYWQGRTISDMLYHLEMGALGMSLTKVAADGASAVYHAAVSILSGKYDVVLAVAYRKESETLKSVVENAAFDPIYLRPLGIDFLTAAAMQANRFMYRYGVTEEQFAEVVVKNRGNAFLNPCAQEPIHLTVPEVLNSKMVSYPLKELDCKPTSDGACALLLASEKKARELTSQPVWIVGLATVTTLITSAIVIFPNVIHYESLPRKLMTWLVLLILPARLTWQKCPRSSLIRSFCGWRGSDYVKRGTRGD